MAKKANKQNVDKVVKKVNKEFEKTSSRIEKLIDDALKQFDGIQNQVQEPVRKLLKELDELRDREMKRFSDEYERRLGEFHELQESILDRLGIASKEAKAAKEEAKKAVKKASSSATTKSASKKSSSAKATARKSAATKSATPKKAAGAKAGTATKKTASPKPKDKSDLTLIKGIGPATARKMKEAGITSIDQIANPSAEDQEKLQAFSNVKGFSTFSDEAKKVI
ncbi:helix-hairpin-helix domain-containing protein [Marinobacter sp. TBZ242]|uniref:Helix-hairpin-helix domain-containing protein n=1 Tax=Marinobacter azerbaijanicus TaxID=3050455 RepID=A0ABT7I798_9GAMM|nr:helix-hairpin-helix domain-containing protein [Marinobacter sp. TBZ242]MDL0429525.1 helix-hairpin-helix domain-containing protein [Marinobacter sp. TBZ242]